MVEVIISDYFHNEEGLHVQGTAQGDVLALLLADCFVAPGLLENEFGVWFEVVHLSVILNFDVSL